MANKIFNSINHAGIFTMRKNASRLVRHNEIDESVMFIALNLATPAKQGDEKFSERQSSEKIVTLNQGEITLAEIDDNSLIAFTMTIATKANTSFTGKVLSAANGESFVAETEMTLYTNGDSVSGIQVHLGYDMPEKQALALIRNHVQKLGKTQQWKRTKGEYVTLVETNE